MTRRQVIEKAILKSYGKSVDDMVDMVDLALEFADDVASEVKEVLREEKPNPLKEKLTPRNYSVPIVLSRSTPRIESVEMEKVTDIDEVFQEYKANLPEEFTVQPKGWKTDLPLLLFVTKNENSTMFNGPVVNIRVSSVLKGDQVVMFDDYVVLGSQRMSHSEMFDAITKKVHALADASDSPVMAKMPVPQRESMGTVVGNF